MSGMRRKLGRVLRGVARIDRSALRAGWWAAIALRRLRGELAMSGLAAVVPPPPPLEPEAIRGVTVLAAAARATCLERSLLIQRWLVEQGARPEVLVGVANSPDEGFKAHAWLPGFDPEPDEFTVLTHLEAPLPLGCGRRARTGGVATPDGAGYADHS